MSEMQEVEGNDVPEYWLSKLCQLIPEYEGGDIILLNTFINSSEAAFEVADEWLTSLSAILCKTNSRVKQQT